MHNNAACRSYSSEPARRAAPRQPTCDHTPLVSVCSSRCTRHTVLRSCAPTVQVHNWRCRRCTFNTDKGIAAKAKCAQVSSPALFVLKGGKPGEMPAAQMHSAQHAIQYRPGSHSVSCRLIYSCGTGSLVLGAADCL